MALMKVALMVALMVVLLVVDSADWSVD